jgi:hypothetical protein
VEPRQACSRAPLGQLHHTDDDDAQELLMDTTVHLFNPIDFGAGAQQQVTFPDSKAKTDPAGNLIVFSEQRGEDAGSLILHRDVWEYAVSGPVTFNDQGLALVRRARAPMESGVRARGGNMPAKNQGDGRRSV